MTDIDILEIDAKIQDNFRRELKIVVHYEERITDISNALKIHTLSHKTIKELNRSLSDLQHSITEINDKSKYNFYIMETVQLIEDYKKIINQPIKMNFVGKSSTKSDRKMAIEQEYISVANKYLDTPISINTLTKQKISCPTCSKKKCFDIVDNRIYICTECGTEQEILSSMLSFKDVDRINITNKYTYDRRIHFRDTINQYQGKQNSTIDDSVYKSLEKQFNLNGLLVGDETSPKEIRFSKITKEHIFMFLLETENTKYYEDVHLIHHKMTGIKTDDISYLEDKLIEDFDLLLPLYDEKFKHSNRLIRKNFINTQYILYQLLKRHKHPCKESNFNILKTRDRREIHDDITRELFLDLNWNWSPLN